MRILISFFLRNDTRSIRSHVEIHAERFPRTEDLLTSDSLTGNLVVLNAQATFQGAVTESTETDFYSTLAPFKIIRRECVLYSIHDRTQVRLPDDAGTIDRARGRQDAILTVACSFSVATT